MIFFLVYSFFFLILYFVCYFRFCYSTMMIQDYGTCLCVFYLLWPILCIYSNSNCWIGDDKSGRRVFCIAHCIVTTTTTTKITTTKKRQIGCGFHFFLLVSPVSSLIWSWVQFFYCIVIIIMIIQLNGNKPQRIVNIVWCCPYKRIVKSYMD